ncbi:MAG: hypothetical protein ABI866_06770 [Dokdonella sp.]
MLRPFTIRFIDTGLNTTRIAFAASLLRPTNCDLKNPASQQLCPFRTPDALTQIIVPCLQEESFMLRNPISFIFKLGKVQSLPFQPLRRLGAGSEVPSLPIASALKTSKVPVKNVESTHSNQMSS